VDRTEDAATGLDDMFEAIERLLTVRESPVG
jgi:hypothetical protein